ncbi:sialate O-acetylesterase [Verrucomicrobiota bacterium]
MNIKQLTALVAITFAGLVVALPVNAKDIHLFILSGQSNMQALEHQKYFNPIIEKEYSGQEIIIVKNAVGGQVIRRWYKNWKPAKGVKVVDKEAHKKWYQRWCEKRGRDGVKSGDLIPNGVLYDDLLEDVKEALGNKKPTTITFVWMQGESDAIEGHHEVYAESLKGVVQQLRDDLNHKDINVVIGLIIAKKAGKNKDALTAWNGVRKAQQELGESGPRWACVSGDDLETNGIHWKKPEGYKGLGKRFAEKAIELIKKNK